MLSSLIPLYYQLLAAYRPLPSAPVVATSQVLGIAATKPSITTGPGITLAFIGDSMIDTLDWNTVAASLSRYFPQTKFKLLDYGYGSTKIDSALDRLHHATVYLDQTNRSLLSLKPDFIVIESFAYNNFGNSPEGLDQHTKSLTDLTTAIRQQLPDTHIILAASIAPNSLVFAKESNFSALDRIEKTATINLYLQNLITYAKSRQFPLADACTGSLIDGQGYQPLIAPDGIHPSTLGSQFFGDILAQTLSQSRLIP